MEAADTSTTWPGVYGGGRAWYELTLTRVSPPVATGAASAQAAAMRQLRVNVATLAKARPVRRAQPWLVNQCWWGIFTHP